MASPTPDLTKPLTPEEDLTARSEALSKKQTELNTRGSGLETRGKALSDEEAAKAYRKELEAYSQATTAYNEELSSFQADLKEYQARPISEEQVSAAVAESRKAFDDLEIDRLLRDMDRARRAALDPDLVRHNELMVASGRVPARPTSWDAVVPARANKKGLTEEQYRANAKDLGIDLSYFEEQVAKQGVSADEAKSTLGEAGVYWFKPDADTYLRGEVIAALGQARSPEDAALELMLNNADGQLAELQGDPAKGMLDYASNPRALLPGGPATAGFYGTSEEDLPWEVRVSAATAAQAASGLLANESASRALDTYGASETGFYDYARARGIAEMEQRGVSPTEEADYVRANMGRWLSEVAIYKTAGLWTAPVFLPFEYDEENQRLVLPPPGEMTLGQAIAPTVEVLGVNQRGELVIRQASGLQHTFDMADIAQSAMAGVLREHYGDKTASELLAEYAAAVVANSPAGMAASFVGAPFGRDIPGTTLWDPEVREAMVKGIASRDNFIALGLDQDDIKEKLATEGIGGLFTDPTTAVPATAALAAAIFYPDAFLGVAGVARLTRSAGRIVKNGAVGVRVANEMSELVSNGTVLSKQLEMARDIDTGAFDLNKLERLPFADPAAAVAQAKVSLRPLSVANKTFNDTVNAVARRLVFETPGVGRKGARALGALMPTDATPGFFALPGVQKAELLSKGVSPPPDVYDDIGSAFASLVRYKRQVADEDLSVLSGVLRSAVKGSDAGKMVAKKLEFSTDQAVYGRIMKDPSAWLSAAKKSLGDDKKAIEAAEEIADKADEVSRAKAGHFKEVDEALDSALDVVRRTNEATVIAAVLLHQELLGPLMRLPHSEKIIKQLAPLQITDSLEDLTQTISKRLRLSDGALDFVDKWLQLQHRFDQTLDSDEVEKIFDLARKLDEAVRIKAKRRKVEATELWDELYAYVERKAEAPPTVPPKTAPTSPVIPPAEPLSKRKEPQWLRQDAELKAAHEANKRYRQVGHDVFTLWHRLNKAKGRVAKASKPQRSQEVAEWLAQHAQTDSVRWLMARVSLQLTDEQKLIIRKDGKNPQSRGTIEDNKIEIYAKSGGLNEETLAHELLHAATAAEIREGFDLLQNVVGTSVTTALRKATKYDPKKTGADNDAAVEQALVDIRTKVTDKLNKTARLTDRAKKQAITTLDFLEIASTLVYRTRKGIVEAEGSAVKVGSDGSLTWKDSAAQAAWAKKNATQAFILKDNVYGLISGSKSHIAASEVITHVLLSPGVMKLAQGMKLSDAQAARLGVPPAASLLSAFLQKLAGIFNIDLLSRKDRTVFAAALATSDRQLTLIDEAFATGAKKTSGFPTSRFESPVVSFKKPRKTRSEQLRDLGFSDSRSVVEAMEKTSLIGDEAAMATLGGQRPEYLDVVIDFMKGQRQKLIQGELTRRDLVKAWIITGISQNASAVGLNKVAAKAEELGLEIEFPDVFLGKSEKYGIEPARSLRGELTIRPEEVGAAWLLSPTGQRFLNDLDNGVFNEKAFQTLIDLRLRSFGSGGTVGNLAKTDSPQITLRKLDAVDDVLREVNEGGKAKDTKRVGSAVRRLIQIADAKEGFIKHLLGLGDTPTLDAVELNFWITGQADVGALKSKEADLVRALKLIQSSKMFRPVAERISARIRKVSETLIEEGLDPDIVMHVAHHWIWDAAKRIQTTHEGMYLGMLASASDAGAKTADEVAEARRLYEEMGTESPFFKRWFGDDGPNGPKSKVVDEAGQPLVVYHGTPGDFDEFDTYGKMAHFGSAEQANIRLKDLEISSREAAGESGLYRRRARGDFGSIIPVYLRITNLLPMPDIGQWDSSVKLAEELIKIFPGGNAESSLHEIADEAEALRRSFESFDDFRKSDENLELLDEMVDLIKAEGYDGITYRNLVEKVDWEEGGSAFIVFDPQQIKSKFNRGTFDVDDPRILHSAIPDAAAAGARGADEIAEARRLWDEEGVESPYFKRWFGDSKVVDEAGEPLVMYHGTAFPDIEAFDTFGGRYGLMGAGAYFTADPAVASGYAKTGMKKARRAVRLGERLGEPAENVLPVYLSVKNPIDMDAPADLARWIDAVKKDPYVEEAVDDLRSLDSTATNEDALRLVEEVLQAEGVYAAEGAEAVRSLFEGMGYDGLTHLGGGRGAGLALRLRVGDVRHRVFVAFEPTQVKSKFNRGTFDVDEPRILHSAVPDFDDGPYYSKLARVVEEMPETIVGTPAQRTTIKARAPQLIFDKKGNPVIDAKTGKQRMSPARPARVVETPAVSFKDTVLSFLLGAGVKVEEISATHLEEFLDDLATRPAVNAKGDELVDPKTKKPLLKDRVSRDEVLEHLSDNRVEVDEVLLATTHPRVRAAQEVESAAFKDLEPLIKEWSEGLSKLEGVTLRSVPGDIHRMRQNPDFVFDSVEHPLTRIRVSGTGARDAGNRPPSARYSVLSRDEVEPLSATAQKVLSLIESTDPETHWGGGPRLYERIANVDEALKIAKSEHAKLLEVAEDSPDLRFYDHLFSPERDLSADLERAKQAANLADELTNSDAFRKWREAQRNTARLAKDSPTTKYGDYVLGGGDNYREVLITLPSKSQKILDDPEGVFSARHGSHWKDPNVLVHVRTTDRVIDGKKILFIEELQSDWHQQGRIRGYSAAENAKKRKAAEAELRAREAKANELEILRDELGLTIDARRSPLGSWRREAWEEEGADRWNAAATARDQVRKQAALLEKIRRGPVPPAPFKDTKAWTSLALKRVLQIAADGDYDGVAVTSGGAAYSIVSMPLDSAIAYYEKILPSVLRKVSGEAPRKLNPQESRSLRVAAQADEEAVEFALGSGSGGWTAATDETFSAMTILDMPKEPQKWARPRALFSPAPTPPAAPAKTGVAIEWKDGRALITAYTAPTLEDFVRVTTELMLRQLETKDLESFMQYARASEGLKDLRIEGDHFIGADAAAAEELFQQSLMKYLIRGRSPTPELAASFSFLKDLIARSARIIKQNNGEISDELLPIFDNLLKSDHTAEPALTATHEYLHKHVQGSEEAQAGSLIQDLVAEGRRRGHNLSAKGIAQQIEKAFAPGSTKREILLPEPLVGVTMKEGKPVLSIGTLTDDGRWRLTADDIEKLQLRVNERRGRAEAELRSPAIRSIADAVDEQSFTDMVDSYLSQDTSWRRIASHAWGTMFGWDAMVDLRTIPTYARHVILGGTRRVTEALGNVLTLVNTEPDSNKLWQFLSGEQVKFLNGRQAMASGTNLAQRFFKATNRWFIGGEADLDQLQAFADLVRRPQFFRANLDAKDVQDAIELGNSFLLSRNRPEWVEAILEAIRSPAAKGARDPQLRDYQMLEILMHYSGVTTRDGGTRVARDATYAQRVENYVTETGNLAVRPAETRVGSLITRPEARKSGRARVAVQVATYGMAVDVEMDWARLRVAIDEGTKDMLIASRGGSMQFTQAEAKKINKALRQLGMGENYERLLSSVGGSADINLYVPKAARKRLSEAVQLGRLNFDQDNLTALLQVMYRSLKLRWTRGLLFLRQRYFFMNTMDHFAQMAVTVGFRPAIASTSRLIAQDVITLPGVARALDIYKRLGGSPEAAENVRRTLQALGDDAAHAVGRLLGHGKYRLEVNPIIEGDTALMRIGGDFYSGKTIRQIAVEEGIFASFDTSGLERTIERLIAQMRDDPALTRRLRQLLDDLSEATTETAEAWGERERLGAMVSLMEMGLPPRQAARLTIDALYDYAGSMSKIDRHWIINVLFPFWAFQKNANRHTVNMMFSPWGAYRMSIIRHGQQYGFEVMSYAWYASIYDPYGVAVDSMPEDLQQSYYALRQVLEFGYGPISELTDEQRADIIEAFGKPFGEFTERERSLVEHGYGGPQHVPDATRRALNYLFMGRSHLVTDDGRAYVLDDYAKKIAATHDLSVYAPYTRARPSKASRRSYTRDGLGLALPLPPTKAANDWYSTVSLLYPEHPYIEVFIPEPTMYAGMRHVGSMLAAYTNLAVEATSMGAGLVTGEESPGTGFIATKGALRQVVEPERAVGAELLVENAAPKRLHPVTASIVNQVFGPGVAMNFPPKADPRAASALNQLPEGQREFAAAYFGPEERWYLPGGSLGVIFELTPGLAELNSALLAQASSTEEDWAVLAQQLAVPLAGPGERPLESAYGTQGEIVAALRAILGVQTTETIPGKTPISEQTRPTPFRSTSPPK